MSWRQLLSIQIAAADEIAAEQAAPPTACPNDGTPLQAGPNGVLHCNFDGYMWPE